jgi:hypothetical protein
LALYTTASGTSTEAVRITAAQNVGIGTSSPQVKLQVSSATTTASGAAAWDSTGATLNLFYTGASATDAGSSVSFSGLGVIKGAKEATDGNGYLSFMTRNGGGGQYATERARIDSSGNLLVGTTSATSSGFLQITASNVKYGLVSRASTTNSSAAGFFNSSGTEVGSINTTGSTTSYVTSSDYRLKEAIAPMTGALAKVALLKPCVYKWKVDGSDGQGFIAHELAEVEAGCVTGEKDAVDADGNPKYQGIDTSFLVATLTAAIQEQQALITQLQADVAALKGASA